ncbi:MAG: permease prefix domain 1-containing protein [Mycobacteriales bacterium]
MSGSQIEQALDAVWARTRGARDRRRIQEELADHLQEALAVERAHGLTPDEAEHRAVERLGDTKTIAAAFPVAQWRIGAAVAALATMTVLVWTEVTTHQASVRTCLGGRCPIWIPRAPQHPIHQRVELVTAAAAGALALIMAIGAVSRWRQAERGYDAAIERRTSEPSRLTTGALLAQSLPGMIRLAAAALAVATLAGVGLAARWQTQAPPLSPTVVALRPGALTRNTTTIDGVPRARPLLRRILAQLPGEFMSVGVHPGKGLVIRTPGTSAPSAHASDPNQFIRRAETDALLEAFKAQQSRYGLHIVHYYVTDTYPGDADAGTLGGDFGRRPIPPITPTPHLHAQIESRLHLVGLHVTRLTITHPNGPFVIAVARTHNPKRYIERSPGPLSRHIAWGLLVIHDQTGIARAVYITRPHARYAEVWYDPRLYPAQPEPVLPIPAPPPSTPHARPQRTPRA